MVETVGIRQEMWFVMIEYAKDQILGVDPPRTTCDTMCLVLNDLLTN
jgi:hypothetical protein